MVRLTVRFLFRNTKARQKTVIYLYHLNQAALKVVHVVAQIRQMTS